MSAPGGDVVKSKTKGRWVLLSELLSKTVIWQLVLDEFTTDSYRPIAVIKGRFPIAAIPMFATNEKPATYGEDLVPGIVI